MEREVVVCEALCFLSNNFDKLTTSQLKPVLVNFYKDEELAHAKDTLHKAITQVIQNDVPHGRDIDLPRLLKRQGPNKSKQTVDDMLTFYAIADEQKLIEKLPVYVAANLLRIPFMNV